MVNVLKKIPVNNSGQWILVRGKDNNSPLILQVQAGPGLPMIPEANTMQRLLKWENNFLVAYWDQRGCGKSFNKHESADNLNFNQLAEDIISCAKFLSKEFNKDKVILVGYSMGATVCLFAAQKEPHLFSEIFAVGADIDVPAANNSIKEFIAGEARKQKNKKRAKEALQLPTTEIYDAPTFQKRAKLISNAGGLIANKNYNEILLTTVRNMLFCKQYRLADIIKAMQGMEFCQNALLPELNTLNLFEKIKAIDVPVHFIQGKKDVVVPEKIARQYFNFLKCNTKSYTEFEHSAHMPHLEEPDKFAEVICRKANESQTIKKFAAYSC